MWETTTTTTTVYCSWNLYSYYAVSFIVVACCCFLHINRSGLIHTQYYAWLPIRYVVCWTERDQRNIYQALVRAKEKHKHTKNDKEKGTRTAKYTCQKKIDLTTPTIRCHQALCRQDRTYLVDLSFRQT